MKQKQGRHKIKINKKTLASLTWRMLAEYPDT